LNKILWDLTLKPTSHAKCPENITTVMTITFQAGQHQPPEGPHNFLRTQGHTCVYMYQKGWYWIWRLCDHASW